MMLKRSLQFIIMLGFMLGVLLSATGYAYTVPDARIVINIPSRTLMLYSGDTIVESYPVGVGRVDFPTPEGEYQVLRKIEDPGWENPYKRPGKGRIDPGTRNPLGTRWIGFLDQNGGEYGIHGTNEPASVGKFTSHGCVRMYIRDAEDLYEKIEIGTPVAVTYDTAMFDATAEGEVKITIFPDWFGKGFPSLGTLKQRILNRYPSAQIDDNKLAKMLENFYEKPDVIAKAPPGSEARVTFKVRVTN
jgi:L,D-transpeptidase ErfK/SrfK